MVWWSTMCRQSNACSRNLKIREGHGDGSIGISEYPDHRMDESPP